MIIVFLKVGAEFICTMLAIDFVSGFVHWFEDTFGTAQTPVYGKWVVVPNTLHHEHPAAFTEKNWLQSSWDLTLASLLILGVAWWSGHISWHIWVFCFLGANANQLHKYAHMSKENTPGVVRFFQWMGLFQKPKHHAVHHAGDKNLGYCVITPYLNPVLDRIGFWRGLERLTVPLLGAPRREDLVNRKKTDH